MPAILLIENESLDMTKLAAGLQTLGYCVATTAEFDQEGYAFKEYSPNSLVDKNGSHTPAIYEASEVPDTTCLRAYGKEENKNHPAGSERKTLKRVTIKELDEKIQTILSRKNLIEQTERSEIINLLNTISPGLPSHASHLIRTNLGILFLSLETIKNDLPGNDFFIQMAFESTLRLKMIMNDLIWVNEENQNLQPSFTEQINFESAFQIPVQELMEGWKSKNLELQIEIDPNINLMVPAQAFTHAVSHLVDNACKFSPEKGVIQIKIKKYHAGDCTITIIDQGPGIPLRYREMVFSKYYQIPSRISLPNNHGLGIGLYIARTFARKFGGDVKILAHRRGCKVQMKI